MNKALLSWSSGKDCALALERVRQQGEYDVVGLLTTVTEEYDRVSMHGVHRSLLEAQAEALGLPLEIVWIPKAANNEIYEQRMRETLERCLQNGIETVIFGDLYLEDIRAFREEQTEWAGMKTHFPIWGEATDQLAHKFIADGYKALTVCVDSQTLAKSFAGRNLDEAFLQDLPDPIDPCGENGEFHTFVYDGPVFNDPIAFSKGEIILRDERFYYCELLLDRRQRDK